MLFCLFLKSSKAFSVSLSVFVHLVWFLVQKKTKLDENCWAMFHVDADSLKTISDQCFQGI